MDFDKIVQRMRKRGQKLWSLKDLEDYSEGLNVYKLIHRLVAGEIIVSIRKGMYLWNMEERLNPEDFYWQLVKKIIQEKYLGQGIVIGEKALAFGLRDYSLPEILSVAVPKDGGKISILGNYILVGQHIKAEKKNSLYALIRKHATRLRIEDVELLVTSPEHGILESMTTRTGSDLSNMSLVQRWLKKNASSLREDVFAEFLPHRYISAMNRLKYLAYDEKMDDLYKMTIRLIERHGKGCHLSREFLAVKKK